MRVWFGNPGVAVPAPDDLVVVIGNEPAPGEGGPLTVRVRSPEDVLHLVHSMYGDTKRAFLLAETDVEYEHECQADPEWRKAVVADFIGHASACVRFWGNSTIDGLHGAYNMCSNIVRLLDAPRLHNVKPLTCPAIVVGAGPSLDKVIHHMKRWRECALIIAADTVAKKLKDAGCDPHIVTPMERLNSTAQKLAGYDGDAVFAGLPVAPKAAVDVFKSHILIGQEDALYEWAGIDDHGIYTGPTTGTMACAVACHMTHGNVYLIGHDLIMDDGAYGEGVGRSVDMDEAYIQVMGNDGKPHVTKPDWAAAAKSLAEMGSNLADAQRVLFNIGAGLGHGIRLPHSLPCNVEDVPDVPCETSWCFRDAAPTSRKVIAAGRVLVRDFDALVEHAAGVKTVEDINLEGVIHERNVMLFSYILRPLFCQMSVERRQGRSQQDIVDTYKQRVANMGRELLGVFTQMMSFFVGAS